MDDEVEARLAAIETALGLMLERMRPEDARAVIDGLRTTTDGARRKPEMRKHLVPTLEYLTEILSKWSKQPPRLQLASRLRGPANDET